MLPPHLHKALLHLGVEGLDVSVLAYEEAALLHDDLRGAFGVNSESSSVQGNNRAHRFSGRVESVDFSEPRVRHFFSELQAEKVLFDAKNSE